MRRHSSGAATDGSTVSSALSADLERARGGSALALVATAAAAVCGYVTVRSMIEGIERVRNLR